MAQLVPENDSRLAAERIQYDAAGTRMTGYLARFKPAQNAPGCHRRVREPGPQPPHSGRRRRVRPRRVPRAGAGPAVGGRRYAGGPGSGGQDDGRAGTPGERRSPRSPPPWPISRGHAESTEGSARSGFCWGGSNGQPAGGHAGTSLNAAAPYYGMQIRPRTCRRSRRRSCSTTQDRRADQRGNRGLRGRAQGQQKT